MKTCAFEVGELKRMLQPFGRFTWGSWVTRVSTSLASGEQTATIVWRLKWPGGQHCLEVKTEGRDWRIRAAHGLRMVRMIGREKYVLRAPSLPARATPQA